MISILMVFCCGCAHVLEITNLDDYRSQGDGVFRHKVTVKIENGDDSESTHIICKQIEAELSRRGCVIVDSESSEYLISCDVGTVESANASNFWVSWPGYIIFAHAWLGYGYDVSYIFNCEILKTADKALVGRVEDSVELHMRYADFGTTWGAGCGWIPYLGIFPSVINGLYVMSVYDEDITPDLRAETHPVLAEFIVDKLIEKMNNGENQ
ncbi:MAG: hypothetical protein ACI4R9_04095 [Kiritimatiellia bacterium]